MWDNHKSEFHLKGHILRIHKHFTANVTAWLLGNVFFLIGEIITQNSWKMCQIYSMFCFEPIQGLKKG